MMKAILYEKPGDYRLSQVEIPTLKYPSTVLLKVLVTNLTSYTKEVLSGKRHYDLKKSIPGVSAIGEVVAVASNVVNLQVGDRVFTDPWYHLNGPEYDHGILIGWSGSGTEQSRAHQSVFQNGTYAEYCVWPAENLTVIPQSLSHIPSAQLGSLSFLSVAHGGLVDDLKAGQTIIVNGASGNLGGCASMVALAMGAAKVVAVGRNLQALNNVKDLDPKRVVVVQLTGDVQNDTKNILDATGGKGADMVFDALGQVPTADAVLPTIKSVREKGTVVWMGGVKTQIPLDYFDIMWRQITIKGVFMCPRNTPTILLALIASGGLDITRIKTKVFEGLENFDKAIDGAAKPTGGLEAWCIIP